VSAIRAPPPSNLVPPPQDLRQRPLAWDDLLALLFAMTFPSFATWTYFSFFAGDAASVRWTMAVCKVLQFSFPVLWVWGVKRERVRLFVWGLRGVREGFFFGLIVLAGMLILYYAYLRSSAYLTETPRLIQAKLEEVGAVTPAKFWLMALFIALLHALLEEYYWRWFVFGRLRGLMPLPLALAVGSIAFAAHHVLVVNAFLRPEHFWIATVPLASAVAAGGAVWAWIYHRTGSLGGPWLSHFLVDAGLMWIGFDLCWRPWGS
jgi:membrane protease YdiL (CAAX protease family)